MKKIELTAREMQLIAESMAGYILEETDGKPDTIEELISKPGWLDEVFEKIIAGDIENVLAPRNIMISGREYPDHVGLNGFLKMLPREYAKEIYIKLLQNTKIDNIHDATYDLERNLYVLFGNDPVIWRLYLHSYGSTHELVSKSSASYFSMDDFNKEIIDVFVEQFSDRIDFDQVFETLESMGWERPIKFSDIIEPEKTENDLPEVPINTIHDMPDEDEFVDDGPVPPIYAEYLFMKLYDPEKKIYKFNEESLRKVADGVAAQEARGNPDPDLANRGEQW